jgi:hypothetical protein
VLTLLHIPELKEFDLIDSITQLRLCQALMLARRNIGHGSAISQAALNGILITDVTEMKGNYCVAGWDASDGRMIRPLAGGYNWTG